MWEGIASLASRERNDGSVLHCHGFPRKCQSESQDVTSGLVASLKTMSLGNSTGTTIDSAVWFLSDSAVLSVQTTPTPYVLEVLVQRHGGYYSILLLDRRMNMVEEVLSDLEVCIFNVAGQFVRK